MAIVDPLAGKLVPVAIFPRFTSLLGGQEFRANALDVSEFEGALLTAWRGPLLGSGAGLKVFLLESTDREVWTECDGQPGGGLEPAEDTETAVEISFSKKWFQAKADVGGTNPGVTFWLQGFLVRREA